ncbi:MAG: hypothetical protein QOG72_442 [Sphingomonadales bacterium]|jgi:hypothetical protein|nr:hypothetical protein [Sphingomonadales bacterium]
MATLADSHPAPARAPLHRLLLERPGLCFWTAGLLIYGLAAWHFASGHFLNQTSRDLWQHLAALRALIADPFHPANPFVASGEGSRHFHPYWVSIALVARAVGWNEWQAIAFAGFVSAGTLLAGIHSFGRAFYRTPWGPLALLLAMAFGWCLPVSHTGYHSLGTLIEGIAYPAALLIGLSLLLWALVIRSLERPARAWLIVPLAAFMFATHQLGAGIGFMAAGCFILLWPEGSLRARAGAGGAIAAGMALATAWPYHDPFEAIARTGVPTWSGGIDFFAPVMLINAFVPSLLGLWGLRHRRFARIGLPVLAAFAMFAGIFLLGKFGLLIATRFVMPAVLMLHIGLGALFLALAEDWRTFPKAKQLGLFTFAALTVNSLIFFTVVSLSAEEEAFERTGNVYQAARQLVRDIPDGEPVAVYDVAVWPVVATGQRVVSVPWPEPMIDDLARRQAAVERLFDPALTRAERLRLARSWGAKSLLLNRHGPLRRKMPPGLLKRLDEQSVRHERAGPFIRFDLE